MSLDSFPSYTPQSLEIRESSKQRERHERCSGIASSINFHIDRSVWIQRSNEFVGKIKNIVRDAFNAQDEEKLNHILSVIQDEKKIITSELQSIAHSNLPETSILTLGFNLQRAFIDEIVKTKETQYRIANNEGDSERLLQTAYVSFNVV